MSIRQTNSALKVPDKIYQQQMLVGFLAVYTLIQMTLLYPNIFADIQSDVQSKSMLAFMTNGTSLLFAFRMFKQHYFNMYGELSINHVENHNFDEEIECTSPFEKGYTLTNVCPDRQQFSGLLLMVHMVIVSLILLNILIALFMTTYEANKERALQKYAWNRYSILTTGKVCFFNGSGKRTILGYHFLLYTTNCHLIEKGQEHVTGGHTGNWTPTIVI